MIPRLEAVPLYHLLTSGYLSKYLIHSLEELDNGTGQPGLRIRLLDSVTTPGDSPGEFAGNTRPAQRCPVLHQRVFVQRRGHELVLCGVQDQDGLVNPLPETLGNIVRQIG